METLKDPNIFVHTIVSEVEPKLIFIQGDKFICLGI